MRTRKMVADLKNFVNQAVRSCAGNYYYFDENGIYRSIKKEEAIDVLNNIYVRLDGSTYYIEDMHILYNMDANILRMAAKRLQVGETFEKFKELYETIEMQHHDMPQGLDRFITRIGLPEFIKSPEYKDRDVFDYIYVDVYIVTEWETDIKEYIIEHQKEIKRRVLDKIQKSKTFQKYGVSMNFLKLSYSTYSRRQHLIRFVFEFK